MALAKAWDAYSKLNGSPLLQIKAGDPIDGIKTEIHIDVSDDLAYN